MKDEKQLFLDSLTEEELKMVQEVVFKKRQEVENRQLAEKLFEEIKNNISQLESMRYEIIIQDCRFDFEACLNDVSLIIKRW